MSALPGVNTAIAYERPALASQEQVAGAPWSHDWRDIYPVAPDMIRNHTTPAYLGILDGTESVTDWNPWEGTTGPHFNSVIRYGYGTPGIQEFAQDAPLAIDSYDRSPDHGQMLASGVSSVAGMVPFLSLPDHGQQGDIASMAGFGIIGGTLPYHYDYGMQRGGSDAISPRQVFRSPPSISDQTAAFYAAGF